MALREVILNNLETLLTHVSQEVSATDKSVNACGNCQSCCTAAGLTRHKVTDMEFALLADRVGSESSQQFRDYIEKKTDPQGKLVHQVCPYYKEGCSVYDFRPFSCRTFGHIREEKTGFPVGCVFTGHEKVFPKDQYYQAVPGAPELRALWREFQLLLDLPERQGSTAAPPDTDLSETYLNWQDPLDRTLEHIAKQRFDKAYEELAALDPALETPARTELWGLTLAAIGQHELALAKFENLLDRVPPRADFLYHAGCSAFLIGDMGTAERYWKQSCQLTPEYSPSWGMLGYLAKILLKWQESADHFNQALHEDENNPFFHLRLGEAYYHLGQPDEAHPHFDFAAQHPSTQESTSALLKSLA